MSQGFYSYCPFICLLKTAAKCTQTYHFGDINDFFLGGAQTPHHTPLPLTPTAPRPSLLKYSTAPRPRLAPWGRTSAKNNTSVGLSSSSSFFVQNTVQMRNFSRASIPLSFYRNWHRVADWYMSVWLVGAVKRVQTYRWETDYYRSAALSHQNDRQRVTSLRSVCKRVSDARCTDIGKYRGFITVDGIAYDVCQVLVAVFSQAV